jgi:NADH dehydrogenase (ubiquinone) 1 alpha/beta subcomplex 1
MLGLRLAKTSARVASLQAVKPSLITVQKRFGGGIPNSHYLPRAEVEHRVLSLLKAYDAVDASKVTPNAHLTNDLGLDSLSCVEFIIDLERDFEIEINDTDAAHIETVEEAVTYFAHMPFLCESGHMP